MASALHVISIITSTLFILSPFNVFVRIVSSGSTQSFTPYPYIFWFLTYLFGFITSLVGGADDIGFLAVNMNGTMTVGLFVYLFWKKTVVPRTRLIIVGSTGVGMIAIGLIITVVLLSTKNTRPVFDVLLCLFTVASNMASLPILPKVYETRRVTYLPLAPIITLIMNSSILLSISMAEKDLYGMMSSLFGCCIGTIVGIFYMIIYIIQKRDEDEDDDGVV